jgi:MFS-type transporter involved in bile tolerance (Atg22 family)
MHRNPPDESPFRTEGISEPFSPVTIDMQERLLTMHPVSAQEIEFLRLTSPVFAVVFCGMAFGALVSLGAVVFSTPLPTNPHAVFFALFVAAGVLTVFFGIQSVWGFMQTGKLVKDIKKRPSAKV